METPQVLLEHHLKALRLPTFLREYDKVAQQCAAEGVDYPRYLLRLSEQELLDRERRATERRIRQARFRVVKSLDSFDFLAIPSLNKALVLELARGEFIDRKENVLALGNSGTGKTHIALALGLAACQKGYRVRFTTAASLVHELMEAKDEKRLLRFQKLLASYPLLIIDELGFVPLSKTGAEMFVRDLQSSLRARRHDGHQQSALQRMDRGAGLRAPDRRPTGSLDPSRPHPGDERRKLPAQGKQAEAPHEACPPNVVPLFPCLHVATICRGAFHSGLNAPPNGGAGLRSSHPRRSNKTNPSPFP